MKLSLKQSLALARSIKLVFKSSRSLDLSGLEIGVCPDFLALPGVAAILRRSQVAYGSQNACWQDSGACTGEVSPREIFALGSRYAIIGHSERRLYNQESDALIAKKVIAVLAAGLLPILCIGESLIERQSGLTAKVLKRQLDILKKIRLETKQNIVIAYEPVWAIGTGMSLAPEDAKKAHALIKTHLSAIYPDKAGRIRVLYGGSVDDKSAPMLAKVEGIDGFLVGGASLKARDFLKICQSMLQ